jgi:lipoprotein LprG
LDNTRVTSKAVRAPGRSGATMSCVRVIAGAVFAGAGLAACSSTPSASAQSLLSSAKSTLDNTSAAHFVLSSSNATTSGGTTITGGEGDVQRPDKLRGSLNIVVNGFKAQFKVIAVGGTTYAELPFSSKYSKINTASFGLGNPGQLLSRQNGLSSLLSAATGAKVTGQQRISGELVDEVSATVPGSSVPILPDANPSEPVTMVAAIDPSNHQLREVTLTGPFVNANSPSTFTLTLTSYGEGVQISLPAAS